MKKFQSIRSSGRFGAIALILLSFSLPGRAGTYISTLQETSPTPTAFFFGVDQTTFVPFSSTEATGSVTGLLSLVPNFGCNASDFTAFPAGDIALLLRAPNCGFSTKGINAQNAGAIAFIIFDNIVEPLPGVGFGSASATIPGIFVTNAAGLFLQNGSVSVNLSVFAVPEPATFGFCAFGLLLVGSISRRVQGKIARREPKAQSIREMIRTLRWFPFGN